MRISDYKVLGFSGSRSVVPPIIYSVFEKITDQRILVGDAKGVDKAVRDYFPQAEVFEIKFCSKGAFAERSIRLVQAIAQNQGCLLSFPDQDCPAGLFPSEKSSKCFSNKGSGTYATLAYAAGLNIPCFVFLQSYHCPWLERTGNWAIHQPVRQIKLF